MDMFYRDILDPSEIYAAMDTYDMGQVVEAAIKAITWKDCISTALSSKYHVIKREMKSKIQSKEARMLGNEQYKSGKMMQAIRLFNQALALAPVSSKEMILAYSNRSAAFFHKRYITECLNDINVCLSLGCSGKVAEKLIKRREEASQFKHQEFLLKIGGVAISPFFQLNERNPNVPCVRSDVSFETDGVKKITANADIKVGSVVGIEKAFVIYSQEKYIVCYYCNKSELCLYPCESCQALFCSEDCKQRCFTEYHRVECHVADIEKDVHQSLALRAAIKMSLMMTWEEFVAASTDVGASRLQAATVNQAFDPEEPLSVLSHPENELIMEGKMYNGSILCARILINLLNFSEKYFPEEGDKREAAVLALGRVMLHLFVTFTNIIETQNTVFITDIGKWTYLPYSGQGMFSMSSKLKHSCEPNLLVMGTNDSINLIALRTIREGEELTISYGGIFYDFGPLKDSTQRMSLHFLRTRKMCSDCRVCLGNWSRNSVATAEMTKKQAKLFEKLRNSFPIMCDVLDSFPFNSTQHLTAYRCFKDFLVTQKRQTSFYFSQ